MGPKFWSSVVIVREGYMGDARILLKGLNERINVMFCGNDYALHVGNVKFKFSPLVGMKQSADELHRRHGGGNGQAESSKEVLRNVCQFCSLGCQRQSIGVKGQGTYVFVDMRSMSCGNKFSPQILFFFVGA